MQPTINLHDKRFLHEHSEQAQLLQAQLGHQIKVFHSMTIIKNHYNSYQIQFLCSLCSYDCVATTSDNGYLTTKILEPLFLHALCVAQGISDLQQLLDYRYVTPSTKLIYLAMTESLAWMIATLEEYASDPAYYLDNTILFYPSNHQLKTSLKLCDVHHFCFQAMNYDTVSIYHF